MIVTPVLTDGFLRPVIRSVMDSAAVTIATVRVASRMENGRLKSGRLFICHSGEKDVLTWYQVSGIRNQFTQALMSRSIICGRESK